MCHTFFIAVFEDYHQAYFDKEFLWLSDEIEGNVAKILLELGERTKKNVDMESNSKMSKLKTFFPQFF